MVLDLAALRGSGGLRREEFEARLAPPDGEPPRVGRVRLLRERVPQQRRPLSRRHPRGGTAPYWGATAGGLPPSSPADGPDSANSASLLRGGRHTPFVPRTGARLPGRAAALRRPGVASWLTSGALRRRGRTSPPSLRLRAPGAVRKLLIWRGGERGSKYLLPPRRRRSSVVRVRFEGVAGGFHPTELLAQERHPGNACVPPANGMARPPPIDAGGTQAFPGRRSQDAPFPGAFARGVPGESPTAHMPRLRTRRCARPEYASSCAAPVNDEVPRP